METSLHGAISRDYVLPVDTDDYVGEIFLPKIEWCERLDAFRKNKVAAEATIRVNSMRLVPLNYGQFVKDFDPWKKMSAGSTVAARKKSPRRTLAGFWVNSIFGSSAWSASYFHWHRNFLTRVAFLTSQGFSDIKIIVKDRPFHYELQSLRALGLGSANLYPFSEVRGKILENVIAVRGIDRHDHELLYDFVRPSALQLVSRKIKDYFEIQPDGSKRSIFLLRGNGVGRSLLNERETAHDLEKRGFEAIAVGDLAYRDQVQLFSNVSKAVAVHGGALTNIMFSEKPMVLELAALGHGLRPDFLPFVASTGGKLTLLGFPSMNPQNDILVPPHSISWWLNRGYARHHLALSVLGNPVAGGAQ